MSSPQRQAQARLAARAVLASGVTANDLTLRAVAAQAGMPLASLTYVYSSVGDLLTDLRAEFESHVAATQTSVGSGGLVVELRRLTDSYLATLADDRANVEILRWQMLLVSSGDLVLPGGMSMERCLREILQRSGQVWQRPLPELATLTQLMISGMHLQFFVRGADQVALRAWHKDVDQMIVALAQIAGVDADPD